MLELVTIALISDMRFFDLYSIKMLLISSGYRETGILCFRTFFLEAEESNCYISRFKLQFQIFYVHVILFASRMIRLMVGTLNLHARRIMVKIFETNSNFDVKLGIKVKVQFLFFRRFLLALKKSCLWRMAEHEAIIL